MDATIAMPSAGYPAINRAPTGPLPGAGNLRLGESYGQDTTFSRAFLGGAR